MLEINPTGAFEVADACGQEKSRERWLTREELIQFFQAMRMAKGFSREHELTMKLILCLCCRKMALCGTYPQNALRMAMLSIFRYHRLRLNGSENDTAFPATVNGYSLPGRCSTA